MEKTTRLAGKNNQRIMIKITKKILFILFATFIATGNVCVAHAATSNLATGDIGEYGAWTTEHNLTVFVDNIKTDATAFQSQYEREYIDTGVPLVAKLGISFMRALTHVAHILDESLVRFVKIFLIVAFLFWAMFEGYRMITDASVKTLPTFQDIIKKAIILSIWLLLLGGGLRWFFGILMGPIVSFGSYVANIILDTVAQYGGFEFSDTCAAIRSYAATRVTDTSIVTPEFAADIICMPTRLSGFYYAAIRFGWSLIIGGFGVSMFTVLIGIILVCMFVYAAYKFAFVAFGVIADLFLVVIMLPFTAISETLNKTSYKGIAGNIYNGFHAVFAKTSSLSEQVKKFVNAAVYFVSLSIVIAISGALLAGAVTLNRETHILTILDGNVITLLITGILVAYIAGHVEDVVKTLGGGIEYAMGTELSNDVKKLYNGTKKKVAEFIKTLKK